MSNNGPSDSTLSIRKNGSSVIVGQGIVYPLEYLHFIQKATSLAELKVVSVIYGYDAIIGIEAEPLTYTDIVERTGLTDRSVSDGLKRALARQIVKSVERNGTRFYVPVAKSIVHEHDHESFKHTMGFKSDSPNDHEHGAKSIVRQQLYQILLDEFGMFTTWRVAQDIALTPKYPVDRILNQIRYTRWEVKHGEDGNPQRKITNPPGRFVFRVRSNRPQPQGFNVVEYLTEIEGWTRDELFGAVYSGDLVAPDIEGSFEYAAWLANEFGEEFD